VNDQTVRSYQFGDFRLDCGKRLLLRRDGTSVQLTPKAFDTLSYLVEHTGRVLGKEELMAALWPDIAVEENNLNQNISLLRRALGEERGDHRYIATIPARGYQFVASVETSEIAAPQLPEGKPSIAVLPFSTVSTDAEYEYFGDGLADDLISVFMIEALPDNADEYRFAVSMTALGVKPGARAVQVKLEIVAENLCLEDPQKSERTRS
jgi:DNA-binding winged helix-turn-helix (wHTH) protein